RLPVFLSRRWVGSCRGTASGLLGDLEPSGERWRVSGGWVSCAVPKEAELCLSESPWSDLLRSQHFFRTSLPQDGVEHSIFTCHPTTI
ncbi:unnamed protein product, partial [Gulo gulo]